MSYQDNGRYVRGGPITYAGKTQSVSKWAREMDMPHPRLLARLYRGWNVRDALLTPRDPRGRPAGS